MRLAQLTLQTSYFEDYLSFLTEVLELELAGLTDHEMKLDFQGTILAIRKGKSSAEGQQELEFEFAADEYEAMIQKITFFYYRKGPTRFLLSTCNNIKCELIDPDGRLWRFSQPVLTQSHFSSSSPAKTLLA